MTATETKCLTVDFYLDLISPFGYLCNHGLRDLAARYPIRIRHHPVNLQRLKLAAGNNGPANRDIPPKIRYLGEDLRRWAERYGIPMVGKLPGADTERVNRGVYLAQQRGVADEYVQIAWSSIWGEGNDPGTPSSLAGVARRMGWNPEDFHTFITGPESAALYEADNVAAIAAGVFGVPIMMIGQEMWWGNDRLGFLEAYIAEQLQSRKRA